MRTLPLAAVWLLAFAVRVLYLWQIADAPFFGLRLGDAEAYHEWARRIAAGDWPGSGVFYQAPLYPYCLALIYSTVGESVAIVRLFQAMLGATSCALLGAAGIALFGRAGLAAGLALAIYPLWALLATSRCTTGGTASITRAVYVPLRQAPSLNAVSVALRTRGEPAAFAGMAPAALASVDPQLAANNSRTMEQAVTSTMFGLNFMAYLLAICGAIAVFLAVVGIYSMMAYSVSQRRHEFGVRMVLGASAQDVVGLSFGRAARVSALGLGVGLLLSGF